MVIRLRGGGYSWGEFIGHGPFRKEIALKKLGRGLQMPGCSAEGGGVGRKGGGIGMGRGISEGVWDCGP